MAIFNKVLILAILPLMMLMIQKARGETCSSETCTGPFTIKEDTAIPQMITWSPYPAMMYLLNETMAVFITTRTVFTQHCYQGGSLDTHTGCRHALVGKPPNHKEASQWNLRNQCQTGPKCPPHGECWGSDATTCFNLNQEGTWSKEQKFEFVNEPPWLHFAFHTCVVDWQCNFHHTTFPLLASFRDSSTSPVSVSLSPAGEEVPTSYFLRPGGYEVDSFTTAHVFEGKTPTIRELPISVSCLSSPQSSFALCQVPENGIEGLHAGEIISVDKTELTGTHLNMAIKVLEPIHEIHPNKMKDNPPRVGRYTEHHPSTIHSKIGASSSVNDVIDIAYSLLYTNMESHYNVLQLKQELHNLKRVVTSLIESVGKVDDELIGNLLNKPSKTKWFNGKVFHQCACFNPDMDAFSNCANSYIFKDGRLLKKRETDLCSSYDANSISQVPIFMSMNYSLSSLQVAPPQGSSDSWEGWTWVAQNRRSLVESMSFSENALKEDSAFSHFSTVSAAEILGWDWFYKISAFVPWVALGLAILALRR